MDAEVAQTPHALQIIEATRRYEAETNTVQLRRRYNSFCPAGRLPEDILVEIFLIIVAHRHNLAWMSYSGQIDDPSRSIRSLLTLLSLVCHYWKVVIDINPRLWAFITWTRNSTEVYDCIARSKNSTLFLQAMTFEVLKRKGLNQFIATIQEIPRSHTLRLWYSGTTYRKPFGQGVTSAPHLKLIHFKFVYDRFIVRDMQKDGPNEPLLCFFKNLSLPKLQHLHLLVNTYGHTYSLYEALIRPSLISLDISMHTFASDFLGLISQLPLLRRLRISTRKAGKIPKDHNPVIMRHLEELELEADDKSCANVLKCISSPHATTIRLVFWPSFDQKNDVPAFYVGKFLRIMRERSSQSLHQPTHLLLHSSDDQCFIRLKSNASLPLELEKQPSSTDPGPPYFEAILGHLPLENILCAEVFAFQERGHLKGTSIWGPSIGRLSKLEDLYYQGLDYAPLFRAMGQPGDATMPTDLASEKLLFPNLKSLRLEDFPSHREDQEASIGQLCDMLESRERNGCKIPLVTCIPCFKLGEECVTRLKQSPGTRGFVLDYSRT